VLSDASRTSSNTSGFVWGVLPNVEQCQFSSSHTITKQNGRRNVLTLGYPIRGTKTTFMPVLRKIRTLSTR